MPGKPVLSAVKARPSPGSPQLLLRVLALNPPAFPSEWPPGAVELGLHCLWQEPWTGSSLMWACGVQMGGRGSATGVLFRVGRMTRALG